MEFDHDLDGPETHHPPYVGYQIDRTVPREERTVEPPDRYPIEACVGQGDRLNDYGGNAIALLRGAEQCAFERQHAIAVSARSFRKEDQRIAGSQSPAYGIPLDGGAPHLPVDKNTALELGEPAEERPPRDLGFCDEGTGDYRAEDGYVGVGDVIGRIENRTFAGRRPNHSNSKSEDPAAPAVIEYRQRPRPLAAQRQSDHLHRH